MSSRYKRLRELTTIVTMVHGLASLCLPQKCRLHVLKRQLAVSINRRETMMALPVIIMKSGDMLEYSIEHCIGEENATSAEFWVNLHQPGYWLKAELDTSGEVLEWGVKVMEWCIFVIHLSYHLFNLVIRFDSITKWLLIYGALSWQYCRLLLCPNR